MNPSDLSLFDSFKDMLSSNAGIARVSFNDSDLSHDYIYKNGGSNKLLVFLPSALPKSKRYVPAFHRWSWMESFSGFDTLCVSDPSLHLDHEILGGWMQGRKESWALEVFLEHIEYLCITNNYQSVIFSGSSLGGFVALQAATIFTNVCKGIKIKCYAENPQIALPLYWIERHMNHLSKVCYGVPSLRDVPEDLGHRLDVVKLINKYNVVPSGLIVVKESDDHHYNVQLDYFNSEISVKNNLRVEVISRVEDSSGHTPLDLEQMCKRINEL